MCLDSALDGSDVEGLELTDDEASAVAEFAEAWQGPAPEGPVLTQAEREVSRWLDRAEAYVRSGLSITEAWAKANEDEDAGAEMPPAPFDFTRAVPERQAIGLLDGDSSGPGLAHPGDAQDAGNPASSPASTSPRDQSSVASATSLEGRS